ncbi:sucrose phosphorylase, partial [Aerococcus sp. L_32]
LLAGKNDLELLENTKEGRNINRHYYTSDEIGREIQRPLVQKLLQLFTFRNESEAFDLAGGIEVATSDAHTIIITRYNADKSVIAEANINLLDLSYSIFENDRPVHFE